MVGNLCMDKVSEQYNQCRVNVNIDAFNPVTKKTSFRAGIEEQTCCAEKNPLSVGKIIWWRVYQTVD